jgi:hypothetical protein
MILYTVMPTDLVYPTEDQEFTQQKMIVYKGIPMIVAEMEDRSYQVIRLLSTDPQHYLESSCHPGAKISF